MDDNTFLDPTVRISPSFSTSFFAKKGTRGDVVLSDLGFSSQLPDFTQSEINLHNEDWKQDNNLSRGRVRFLSHDDGSINPFSFVREKHESMLQIRGNSVRYSQSGSWLTFTHSEKDLSELEVPENHHCSHSRPSLEAEYPERHLRHMTYGIIVPRDTTKICQPHMRRSKSMDHCATGQRRRFLFHQAASLQKLLSPPNKCKQISTYNTEPCKLRCSPLNAPKFEDLIVGLLPGEAGNLLNRTSTRAFERRTNCQIVVGNALFEGRVPGLVSELVVLELRHPIAECNLLQCTHGGKTYLPFGKMAAS